MDIISENIQENLAEHYLAIETDEENRKEFIRWHEDHPDASEKAIKAKITRMKDHPMWRRALKDVSEKFPDDRRASVLATCVYNMELYRAVTDPDTGEQTIPAEKDPSAVVVPPAGGHIVFPYGFESFARDYLRKAREPKEMEQEMEEEKQDDLSLRDRILLYVERGIKDRNELEEKLKKDGYDADKINSHLEDLVKEGTVSDIAVNAVDPVRAASVSPTEPEQSGNDTSEDDRSDRNPVPEKEKDGDPVGESESGFDSDSGEKSQAETGKGEIGNPPYEITTDDKGRQTITVHSGCSIEDLKGLEVKDGAKLVFDAGVRTDGGKYNNRDKGTVAVTAEMLAFFGPKVNHLVIAEGTRIETGAYGEGDMWGKNLTDLHFLEIRNNEGMPGTNGKGVFEGYQNNLSVAIIADGEVTLGNRMFAGANLDALVHYSTDGLDHGLTVGDYFAFGSTVKTDVRGLDKRSYESVYGTDMKERAGELSAEAKEFLEQQVEGMKSANAELVERAKEDLAKAKTSLAEFVSSNGLDKLFGEEGSDMRKLLDAAAVKGGDLDRGASRDAVKAVRDRILANADGLIEDAKGPLQGELMRRLESVAQFYGAVSVLESRDKAYGNQLEAIGDQWDGTYVSLGGSINAGESFLAKRSMNVHSSVDPGREAARKFVWEATRDICNEFVATVQENAGNVNEKIWSDLAEDLTAGLSKEEKEEFTKCLAEYQEWVGELKGKRIDGRQVREVSDDEMRGIWEEYDKKISGWKEKSPEFVEKVFNVDFPVMLSEKGGVQDFDEMRSMLACAEKAFVISAGSKFGAHSLSYTDVGGIAIDENGGDYRQFRTGAERLLSEEIKSFNEKAGTVGLPGVDDFRDDLSAYKALLSTRENDIMNAIGKQEDPSSKSRKEETGKDETQGKDVEKLKKDLLLVRSLRTDALQRIGFLVNLNEQCATKEIWMKNRGYAFRSARNALESFKRAHANNKTKDFTQKEDVYTFIYDQATDKEKAEYDKLVSEVQELEKDPGKVHFGDHCVSDLKSKDVTFFNVDGKNCEAIGLGCDNGRTHCAGRDNSGRVSTWAQIDNNVTKSGWLRNSDIMRGKVICAKENFKEWVKACRKTPFRIMRLSEALIDMMANLLELLFNLAVFGKDRIVAPLADRVTQKASSGISDSLQKHMDANNEVLVQIKDGKTEFGRLPEGIDVRTEKYVMRLRGEEGTLDEKKISRLQDYLEKKNRRYGLLKKRMDVIRESAGARIDDRLGMRVAERENALDTGKNAREEGYRVAKKYEKTKRAKARNGRED